MGTLVESLFALAAGAAQAGQYKQQARIEEFNAKQEQIGGLQKQNDQTDELLDTLAAQRVALAGGGADLSTGLNRQIFGSAFKRGDQVRRATGLDAAISSRSHLMSSRALMLAADSAMLSGIGNAIGTVDQAAERAAARG